MPKIATADHMLRLQSSVQVPGEVLGVESLRRWDDQVRLAVVSAVGLDGATVTQVAQRHEVTRQQIHAWRHERKRKGLWSLDAVALFLPAGMVPAMEVTTAEPPARAAAPASWVELRLANGRVLRFESNIGDVALSRVIREVDAAWSGRAPGCVCIRPAGRRTCQRGSAGWRRWRKMCCARSRLN